MSQQNVEAFERAVEAINRRDIDALAEELDSEVVWDDVFGLMLGGEARTYQGHEGVGGRVEERKARRVSTFLDREEALKAADRVRE